LASVFQPVDSLDIPFTGQAAVSYRKFTQPVTTLFLYFTGRDVGEIIPDEGTVTDVVPNEMVFFRGKSVILAHTAPPGSGIEYLSGCTCCQATIACLQTICDQCPNGYAPSVFDWFIDGGIRNIGGGDLYYYPPGPVFTGGQKFGGFSNAEGTYYPSLFNSTGSDCEWVATIVAFPLGRGFYFKLYYSSGWKILIDNWDSNFGTIPYPGSSGNELIFTLDTFSCCPPAIVYPADPTLSPTGGSLSTLSLFSGTPVSVPDPFTITFGSCGCGAVTVPCCAEAIPRALRISIPGATPLPTADGTTCQLAFISADFWKGDGYGGAFFALAAYRYTLSCITGTWNLKIHLIDTPFTLVYDEDATSAVCYPLYLVFPQTAFDFGGYYSGDTFTIDVHI
jgi:hypothetical protein